MPKAQMWTLVAVIGVVILGLVGWMVWNRPSDGSTKLVNPTAPDAASIAMPVPGKEAGPAGGVSGGGAPAVDAQGAAVIR